MKAAGFGPLFILNQSLPAFRFLSTRTYTYGGFHRKASDFKSSFRTTYLL
jgi:hypothetical protein